MIKKKKQTEEKKRLETKGRVTNLNCSNPKVIYDATRAHVTNVTSKYYSNVGFIGIHYQKTIQNTKDNTTKIVDGMGHGTGTLIGPNIVLTCAHNTDMLAIENIKVTHLTFTPGVTKEDDTAKPIRVVKWFVHQEYKAKNQVVEKIGTDIAILVLEDSVPVQGGYVLYKALSNEELEGLWVKITGYPGDFKEQDRLLEQIKSADRDKDIDSSFVPLMMRKSGKIEVVLSTHLRYHINTSSGQSGAGIVQSLSESEYLIVGVHNGSNSDKSFQIASRITKEVEKWIDDLREEHEIKLKIPDEMKLARSLLAQRVKELNCQLESLHPINMTLKPMYQLGSGAQGEVQRMFDTINFQNYAKKRVVFSGNLELENYAIKELEIIIALAQKQIEFYKKNQAKKKEEREDYELIEIYKIEYYPYRYFEVLMELGMGTLHSYSKYREESANPFSTKDLFSISNQIYLQTILLRDLRVYHRDIKPENVIITNKMKIKLTDFGISIMLDENQSEKGTFEAQGTELFCCEAVRKAFEENLEKIEYDLWEGEIETILNTLCYIAPDDVSEEQIKEMLTVSINQFDRNFSPIIEGDLRSNSLFVAYDQFEVRRLQSKIEENNLVRISQFLFQNLSYPECKKWLETCKASSDKYRNVQRQLELLEAKLEYKLTYYEKAKNLFEEYIKMYEDVMTPLEKTDLLLDLAKCENSLYNSATAFKLLGETLTKKLEILHEGHPSVAEVYIQLGYYYNTVRDHELSHENFHKGLEILLKVYGENHIETSYAYNYLAMPKKGQSKFDEALVYYNKALEIQKKILGPFHISISDIYYNIGNLLRAQSKFDKALEIYFQSIEIKLMHLDQYHLSIAFVYNEMAICYKEKSMLNEALEYNFKALNIRKKLGKDMDLEASYSYNNIAAVYQIQSKFQEAVFYFKIHLEIKIAVFGEDNLKTAIAYNNLATAYADLGNYQESYELQRKSLDIKLKLGGENPSVANSYANLGKLCLQIQKIPEAKEFLQKGLEIRKKFLGEDHIHTAISYHSLGKLYLELKEYENAEIHYNLALKIRLKLLTEKNLNTASTYQALGVLYSLQDRQEIALEFLNKALQIQLENLKGNFNNDDLSECYRAIGNLYAKQEKFQEARETYVKALDIKIKIFGEEHKDIASIYQNLGDVIAKQGSYDEAWEFMNKAVNISKKILGEESLDVAKIYESMADVAQKLSRSEQAKEMLEKSSEIKLKIGKESN